MPVMEENPLANFGMTLDHFYSIIKAQAGNMEENSKFQLQATAMPLAISSKDQWFSLGILTRFADVGVADGAVSDTATKVNSAHRVSQEFLSLLGVAMSLVQTKTLPGDVQTKIDNYTLEISNLDEKKTALQGRFQQDWQAYATATMKNPADLLAFTHWSAGYPHAAELATLFQDQARAVAMSEALSQKQYADPSHAEIADLYTKATSPAVRMHYPKYPDSLFSDDDKKKLNPVYLAGLSDNMSPIFDNSYTVTFNMPVSAIETVSQGGLQSTLSKTDIDNMTRDSSWSVSGSGGGFLGIGKVSGDASDTTKIKEDFSHVQTISVETKGLVAIPFTFGEWFDAGVLDGNALIRTNPKLFQRYLGQGGSLLYYPTHLIVARGLKLTFQSSQDWQYDYENHWKAGGGGSGSFFGISWGTSASKQVDETQHKVQKRGHDLVLDDGENSLRVMGYIVKGAKPLDDISGFSAKVAFASELFSAAFPEVEPG